MAVIKRNTRNSNRKKKARSLEERKNANKKAREEKFLDAKRVYQALCDRTVKEPYLPSLGEFVDFEDTVKELGLSVEGYFKITNKNGAKPIYGNANDPSFLRGGLTRREKVVLEKSTISNKTISYAKDRRNGCRYIQRYDETMEPRITVFLDGNHETFLYQITNLFDEVHLESRLEFLSDHFIKCWNKCCGLSGHINWDRAFYDFKNDPKKLQAFFGSNYKNYEVLRLDVMKEGEGSTGKLYYINPKGEEKSFQFGNGLLRYVFGQTIQEKKELRENAYHEFSSYVLAKLGRFLYDPNGYLAKVADSTELPSSMKMAINQWEDGTHAPPAFHADGTVMAACLTSAMPSIGSGLLDSVRKANCDAGGLCHEIGGFIFPYAQSDAIIFNGNDIHGPTSPSPMNRSRGTKNRVGRNSFVTFLKFMKNDNKF